MSRIYFILLYTLYRDPLVSARPTEYLPRECHQCESLSESPSPLVSARPIGCLDAVSPDPLGGELPAEGGFEWCESRGAPHLSSSHYTTGIPWYYTVVDGTSRHYSLTHMNLEDSLLYNYTYCDHPIPGFTDTVGRGSLAPCTSTAPTALDTGRHGTQPTERIYATTALCSRL